MAGSCSVPEGEVEAEVKGRKHGLDLEFVGEVMER